MSKPKQNCTVVIQVSLHQPGKETSMVKVTLDPTDRATAERRYRELTPIVFEAGTKFGDNRQLAKAVADNIGDILAKHGKKVGGIV